MANANNAITMMKQNITSCMLQKIKVETDKKKARAGVVSGSNVIIGNHSYPAIPVVDTYYEDGDTVWCLCTDSQAIIVGG